MTNIKAAEVICIIGGEVLFNGFTQGKYKGPLQVIFGTYWKLHNTCTSTRVIVFYSHFTWDAKDFVLMTGVTRLRRDWYSLLLDHSSISRARRTGRGCESCLVWAFLNVNEHIRESIYSKLTSKVQSITTSLALCTTQQGLKKPCHKSELGPRKHPHLIDPP